LGKGDEAQSASWEYANGHVCQELAALDKSSCDETSWILTVWPELSEHIRNAIMTLIESDLGRPQ
jgi:hypothetical protein